MQSLYCILILKRISQSEHYESKSKKNNIMNEFK